MTAANPADTNTVQIESALNQFCLNVHPPASRCGNFALILVSAHGLHVSISTSADVKAYHLNAFGMIQIEASLVGSFPGRRIIEACQRADQQPLLTR
jgi:hypothetical protein